MPLHRTFTLVVTSMGLFGWLFGCFGNNEDRTSADRYVSPQSFEQNLARQTSLSPQTLTQLLQYGVNSDSALKLEYFFYTDDQNNATALTSELEALGYSAESGLSSGNEKLFLVTGWSTPITMSESNVVSWTEQMVRLGYKHDAEFDGWGTTPEQ